nr:immunoglobulin heavy chain junction region [Macaca mulatta]MOV47024.1 immunoglobulin heavy chain junction region [Macaca mulatta]
CARDSYSSGYYLGSLEVW